MFHVFDKINKNEVYIIAEMSANHGGDINKALQIVRESAKAGADCLKIQTYTADSITIDCDSADFRIHDGLWDGYKLYDLYTDAGTPYEWHQAIMDRYPPSVYCGFSIRDSGCFLLVNLLTMRKKVLTIAGKICLPRGENSPYHAEKKVLTVRGKNSLPNGGKFTLPPTIPG